MSNVEQTAEIQRVAKAIRRAVLDAEPIKPMSPRTEIKFDRMTLIAAKAAIAEIKNQPKPEINLADLQIDTYTSGLQVPATVTITHLPTGIVASSKHPSRIKAREEALQQIREKMKRE